MSKRKKMLTAEEIKAAALELPQHELDGLIEDLNSMHPVESVAGKAWIDEAERRIELYRAGKVTTYDAEDVLADPDEDA